jgi:hypothetical protein
MSLMSYDTEFLARSFSLCIFALLSFKINITQYTHTRASGKSFYYIIIIIVVVVVDSPAQKELSPLTHRKRGSRVRSMRECLDEFGIDANHKNKMRENDEIWHTAYTRGKGEGESTQHMSDVWSILMLLRY